MSLKPDGLQCSFAKFLTEEQIAAIQRAAGAETGDILFFVQMRKRSRLCFLGALRLELAKRLDLIDQTRFDVLWVTDFPLLEWDEEENRYVACHHPFTSPRDEDIPCLTPTRARLAPKHTIWLSMATKRAADPSASILPSCRRKCLKPSALRPNRRRNALAIHRCIQIRHPAARRP